MSVRIRFPAIAILLTMGLPLLAQAAQVSIPVAQASASGVASGSSAAYAVDGNQSTFWSAGAFAPQSITLDLGEPKWVSSLNLITSQYPAGPTAHQISAGTRSDELISIGTLAQSTVDGQSLQFHMHAASPGRARLVRFIRVATTQSPSWVGWREISVRGPASSPAAAQVDFGMDNASVRLEQDGPIESGTNCSTNRWSEKWPSSSSPSTSWLLAINDENPEQQPCWFWPRNRGTVQNQTAPYIQNSPVTYEFWPIGYAAPSYAFRVTTNRNHVALEDNTTHWTWVKFAGQPIGYHSAPGASLAIAADIWSTFWFGNSGGYRLSAFGNFHYGPGKRDVVIELQLAAFDTRADGYTANVSSDPRLQKVVCGATADYVSVHGSQFGYSLALRPIFDLTTVGVDFGPVIDYLSSIDICGDGNRASGLVTHANVAFAIETRSDLRAKSDVITDFVIAGHKVYKLEY